MIVLKLNLKIAKELIENISPNKSNMKNLLMMVLQPQQILQIIL